ncbi:Protein arginine N-methyltransferase 3 [Orobanche minor]
MLNKKKGCLPNACPYTVPGFWLPFLLVSFYWFLFIVPQFLLAVATLQASLINTKLLQVSNQGTLIALRRPSLIRGIFFSLLPWASKNSGPALHKQMDSTAVVELEPKSNNSTGSEQDGITWCYGLVLWFETGFTKRFCRENPVVLSTSPYDPNTHWSQTILTFREPIGMASNKLPPAAVGGKECPAVRIQSRISIVRTPQYRCIDISVEPTGIGSDGRKRIWPAQIFTL